MKTNYVALALFLILIQSVNAQKTDAEEMAAYQTKTMTAELNLSEEQKPKVAAINTKYAEESANLINADGSMFGKMGDMKAINKRKNAELEKVLNERQMEKYEDDLAPKMRKHMRKHMMG
ncbi:hypothetical protein HME9304_01380 [Flagellimonas maritima]|uniref:DUF4890 domain-containing protein n=1 Tax=Flagellimonas maritima TaxID=1383885 RepID=A0A2Z4LRQ4_9FLAO|nr:hypothetical protein [Allomuricauda aurantiaca]AWX44380.1 hypothetical protein HME9304_01380 [Allomuricauda aurantiaca]